MTLWSEPEPPMPSGLNDDDLAILLALATLAHIGPATLVRCVRAGDLVHTWRELCAGRSGQVAALRPRLLAYVACDPAALARLARASLSA